MRESLCPFCGDTESLPLPVPHSRSSRAAMVFGAATMVTALACGGTVETSDAGTGPAPDAPIAVVPPYGLPPDASFPPPDASPPPPDAAPPPPDAAVPPYGAPPPPDAAVPPYGAPPPPDAGP